MTESATCDIVWTGKISETALHEAAHCVAAFEYGISIHGVSLDEAEVILESPGDYLEQGQHHGAVAAGYAIVALAGQAAAPKTGMSKSDQLLLQNAFFLGSWSEPVAEMHGAFSALAALFVRDHRGKIERLAEVLDKRRRMSGAELADLLGAWGHD